MGVSSACSVMDTTLTPLRRSMDLKATACSRLRVNRDNFQTKNLPERSVGLGSSVDHLAEFWAVGNAAALGPRPHIRGPLVPFPGVFDKYKK